MLFPENRVNNTLITGKIPTKWRIDLTICILLFVANLLVRLPLTVGFDGLYGQDAYAYFDFARDWLSGSAGTAFHWPLGYPALLLAGFGLFGASGQAINVLLGSALAPLVYVLARQIGLEIVGAVVAALVMAVCGQAVQSSVVVMADVPALFWALVSAVALARYTHVVTRTRKSTSLHGEWWLALAALTLALASATRWIYLTLAVPWALVVVMAWGGLANIRWRHALMAAGAAAVILVPQLVYNLGENPYSWSGWTLDNALRSTFADTQGRLVYAQVNAVFFASFVFDPYYLSPLLLPLVMVGGWAVRWNKMTLLLLVGWILAPYLFSIGMPQQNIRFLLTSFPAAAVLVGAGFQKIWIRTGTSLQLVMIGVVVVGLAQTISTSQSTIGTFLANQRQHKEAVTWAAAQIPDEATVYTFGVTLIMQHDTAFEVYEIYYETPETLDAKWVRGREDYLLLNLWEIENQWAGHAPQIVYHWLRDERGLTQIGKQGNYTLFRVQG